MQTEKAKSNIQINDRKTRNQNPKQTTEEQEETQGLQGEHLTQHQTKNRQREHGKPRLMYTDTLMRE